MWLEHTSSNAGKFGDLRCYFVLLFRTAQLKPQPRLPAAVNLKWDCTGFLGNRLKQTGFRIPSRTPYGSVGRKSGLQFQPGSGYPPSELGARSARGGRGGAALAPRVWPFDTKSMKLGDARSLLAAE